MHSAPPAMTASAAPESMLSTAFVIACTEDAQELETVNAGTRSGMPEPRATSLAMLGVLTDGITLPKTSAPTSAGSISVRLTSSVTAILPRSSGVRPL